MLKIGEVLVLLIGVGVSLFFLTILKINNLLAWLLFGGWVLMPYIVAAIRGYFINNAPLKKSAHFIALVVAVFAGLYLLLDAIYIDPDPQGGLVVLMVPIIQVPIYLVFYLVAVKVGKNA